MAYPLRVCYSIRQKPTYHDGYSIYCSYGGYEEMTKMKTIILLLILFLSVGLFARQWNTPVRVLLIAGILSAVLYATFL